MTAGRREDGPLLTGRATFVPDVELPGLLEVAFVRSPVAHARLAAVDTTAARTAPGVRFVAVAASLAGAGLFPDLVARARPVREPALCDQRVRYVGAPIAAIVADDRYLAEDAAELVVVEYEELTAVATIDDALRPDAPRLYEDWPDNRLLVSTPVALAVDEAFSNVRVISGTYQMQRQAPQPMETRGVVADYRAGRLTVWTSTQVPHVERTVLARTLGMSESDIRVIAPAVGGGFGGKLHVYREDVVVAWLACHLGRPVRWIEDRREHFLASSHARDQRMEMAAALDEDGGIAALRCQITCDVGSGEILPPGLGPPMVSGASLTGPYRIPLAAAAVTCVVTNKTPSGAYRGFGTPEMVFALERLIEKIARETGQDSTALRRRLLLRPEDLPYTTALGRRIDSGSHRQAFEQAVVWAHDVRQRRAADARGSIGIGFASYIEGIAPNYALTSGLWPAYESCTVRIDPDGKVVVAGGVCPTGQGLETMMAGVTSRALGVPSDDVVVRLGDTDLTPYGLGSFGSRSTVVASGAILRAGDRLRTKVIEIAAGLLEADGADLVMADGQVHVRGSQTSSVSLADIAAVAYFRTDRLPPGVEPGLEASAAYDPPGIDFRPDADGKMNICVTYTNSTHAAVVDVDRSTGQVTLLDYLAVHDAGPLLHPQLADGQVRGGLAQGIGGALYEELTYSPDGQPLVTSFMDYLLPGAGEVPDLTVEHLSSPSPITPLGLKGVGEAGATGPAGAIANAVCDALSDLAIDIVATPITPARLRAMIRAAAATTN